MEKINDLRFTKFATREIVFVHTIDEREAKVIFLRSPNLGLCPLNKDRVDLLSPVNFNSSDIFFEKIGDEDNIKIYLHLEYKRQYASMIREFVSKIGETAPLFKIPNYMLEEINYMG